MPFASGHATRPCVRGARVWEQIGHLRLWRLISIFAASLSFCALRFTSVARRAADASTNLFLFEAHSICSQRRSAAS